MDNVLARRVTRRRAQQLALPLAALLAGWRPGGALAQATPQPVSQATHDAFLIDVAAAQQHEGGARFRPLALAGDVTPAEGVIPGSALVDWHELELLDSVDDAAVTGWADNMSALFARLGLDQDADIVIYDDGSLFAPRAWWVLCLLGYDEAVVLDGGFIAWRQAGGALEPGPAGAKVATAPPPAAARRWEMLARQPEVLAHLHDPDWALVDARTPEEYERGHIPGAVNINYLENVTGDAPARWRAPEELRALYAAAGVTPDKHIVPYCATGARSALTDFTLRWLGYPSVSLYSASWQEWSALPDSPTAKGPNP
ncbi:MAG: rhodanese-like domain-containing protein [Thermomicrobiales bacterium]